MPLQRLPHARSLCRSQLRTWSQGRKGLRISLGRHKPLFYSNITSIRFLKKCKGRRFPPQEKNAPLDSGLRMLPFVLASTASGPARPGDSGLA